MDVSGIGPGDGPFGPAPLGADHLADGANAESGEMLAQVPPGIGSSGIRATIGTQGDGLEDRLDQRFPVGPRPGGNSVAGTGRLAGIPLPGHSSVRCVHENQDLFPVEVQLPSPPGRVTAGQSRTCWAWVLQNCGTSARRVETGRIRGFIRAGAGSVSRRWRRCSSFVGRLSAVFIPSADVIGHAARARDLRGSDRDGLRSGPGVPRRAVRTASRSGSRGRQTPPPGRPR